MSSHTGQEQADKQKQAGGDKSGELLSLPLFVLFAGQKPNGSIKGAIKHQEVAEAPKNLPRLLLEMQF